MKEDEIEFKEVYYSNGQLDYKHQFLRGKKHGEQLGYFSNDEIMYKHQYVNGELHGGQLGYHCNGELRYKEYYINDKRVLEKEWLEYNTPQHQTQFLTDLYV